MMIRFSAALSRFVTADKGTVATTRVFMVGAALALGISVVAIFAFGADATPEPVATPQERAEAAFREANRGRDRVTVLAEGPRQYYSPNEMRQRFELFADPDETSAEDVRSAHRRWVRRVADPAYSQPGRAADMVRILEQALEARGLEPHRIRG